MAEYIKAASIHDVPEGTMKTVVVNGKKIALIHAYGQFFAVDDTCSHEECSLGTEGFLEGETIICGCHGARFDAKNGNVLSLPATRPLSSYKVKIVDHDIYIYV